MIFFSIYVSKTYWSHFLHQWKQILESFFYLLGLIVTIVSILIFLLNTDLQNQMKDYCYYGIIIAVFLAIWLNRPILSVVQQLPQRDVKIEIRVADIFDIKGAYVIGTNTTFDTEIGNGIISESSIQGQFTKKFFQRYNELDDCLNTALANFPSSILNPDKMGKKQSYEMGTVVKITIKNGSAYLLAMATMNDMGTAKTTLEDIKTSLSKLWKFISMNGGTEPVIIPILGSNYGRLTEKRDQIINEIVKSFILECTTQKFTEKLIIVIRPDDYIKWNLDLNELKTILEYQCKFSKF
jgi:hypothetical protein